MTAPTKAAPTKAPASTTKAPAAAPAGTVAMQIPALKTETVVIPIVGTSPLLMHAWSEKARKQMLDSMQGRKSPKMQKDPDAEYQAAFYRQDDGTPGFPALAFKAATVEASRLFGKDVTKVALRQSMFFHGTWSKSAGQVLVPIHGDPTMREDVVRVGVSGTDLRYRPEFAEWSSVLTVTYVVAPLALDSVLTLVQTGGMGTGIGDWRPEKGGNLGTYAIDPTREVELVRTPTFGLVRG
jgi:hypothetical protein